MNVLDENVPVAQRRLLRAWRIPVRHLGYEIGRRGMTDDDIIPFLLTLRRPAFFTLDWDYYQRSLCHDRYCLVHLGVKGDEAAFFIRRLLRHNEFDTKAKRVGAIIRVTCARVSVWRLHSATEVCSDWVD